MKILLFILSLLAPGYVLGQMPFNPHHLPDVNSLHFFDKDFIRQHRIVKISSERRLKPDNKPVSAPHLYKDFKFNSQGNLIAVVTIAPSGAWRDSLTDRLEYDLRGNLVSLRSHDAFGYYSLEYAYDTLSRITHERFFREGPGGQAYLVGDELSVYKDYGNQLKRTISNSQGSDYKEVITYLEKGVKTGESERYLIGSRGKSTNWLFGESLLLKTTSTDLTTNTEFETRFNYDSVGRISGWETFKDSVKVKTASVGWESGLPVDIVIRDEEKKTVEIIRFSYTVQ